MTPIDVDRNALVRLFFEESQEGLATMEEALVTLEAGAGQSDALKALFRAAHTLKGNAASLGLHRDRRDDPRVRTQPAISCISSSSPSST